MKKIVLIFLFLSVAVPAWSLSYIVEGPHPDADKTYAGDSQMCWAASLSNVLSYTGWDAGLTADEIMSVYRGNFPNIGGWFESGLSYWFNGDDLRGISTGGGGYYSGIGYSSITTTSIFSKDNLLSDIDSWLHDGSGINLDIEGGGTGHALTVYGIEYDETGYTGLWVADGNDGIDTLKYLSIYQQYWNVFKKDVWYIDGGAYDGWLLNLASGLEKRSTVPVPEPGAMLLVLCGLPVISRVNSKRS